MTTQKPQAIQKLNVKGLAIKSAEVRFWARVNCPINPDSCWEWSGSKNKLGYGKFSFGRGWIGAHRYSFVLHGGILTKEKPFTLHSCDNPPCTNPRHLRAGNSKDNLEEMALKGRHHCQLKNHCPQGHPYSGANLYIAPFNKARRCRICMAIQRRGYNEKRKLRASRSANNGSAAGIMETFPTGLLP